mgnify:FL=1
MLKLMSSKFKPIDYFISAIFFAIFFLSIRMISSGKSEPILFISSGNEKYEYDLSSNKNFSIEGAQGITNFSICNGKVFITDSPCQNKICIQSGKISKNGQWLCCAPNKIFAIIKSESSQKENEVDAISF